MLICLMSLKNQVVYIQFHPVAYMVKLNIELSMASLITKLARGTVEDRNNEFMVESSSHNQSHIAPHPVAIGLQSGVHSSAVGKPSPAAKDFKGIRTLKEVDIRVENIPDEERGSISDSGVDEGFDGRRSGHGVIRDRSLTRSDDELPLHHPKVIPKGSGGW
jgi:hypothetical protein